MVGLMKVKEEARENLYEIVHEVLATDTVEYETSLVEAKSKKEALEIFLVHYNKVDMKFYKYLTPPELKDVYKAKVIKRV